MSLAAAMLGLAGGVALLAGCTRRGEEIPPAEVKTVEAYGLTLDESASPQEVAFVLLRALTDDVLAAQDRPPRREDHKAALNLTFSLAAYSKIDKQIDELIEKADAGEAKEPERQRHRAMYRIVRYWAPIVAHYVRSFDADFPDASKKMKLAVSKNEQTAHVYYDVSHDPSETDPARRRRVTLDIQLAKEAAAGRSYWRVTRIGYLGPGDRVRSVSATRPVSSATAPAVAK